ncbi:MAG: response regulator [Nitrospinae bacterium]|nr:response regulator [Nitrospinota bacterium]
MALKKAVILLAEDNPADQELTRRALMDWSFPNTLHVVDDGAETISYLKREGRFSNPDTSPKPDIILMDINMPRMDGFSALKEIRNDQSLKTMPIIMLTTSNQERDVACSYSLGANAFITKPLDFEQFQRVLRVLQEFWLSAATLPPKND